ncbi:hypothetical protein THAOC_02506 [Thalassiosira oceanica]|uniref:Uncharacterized protein n=1 Tax=Thalassiosira oceanica TaxID=159749 RepID=K0TAM1_THAOC|nr:hypothetical protein THAOC_02506 [Thalassiosira oceanica]|eukprot:EJK75758.1 hypothetical protein THAOC_02506 [Thalassiosira oceanica]
MLSAHPLAKILPESRLRTAGVRLPLLVSARIKHVKLGLGASRCSQSQASRSSHRHADNAELVHAALRPCDQPALPGQLPGQASWQDDKLHEAENNFQVRLLFSRGKFCRAPTEGEARAPSIEVVLILVAHFWQAPA